MFVVCTLNWTISFLFSLLRSQSLGYRLCSCTMIQSFKNQRLWGHLKGSDFITGNEQISKWPHQGTLWSQLCKHPSHGFLELELLFLEILFLVCLLRYNIHQQVINTNHDLTCFNVDCLSHFKVLYKHFVMSDTWFTQTNLSLCTIRPHFKVWQVQKSLFKIFTHLSSPFFYVLLCHILSHKTSCVSVLMCCYIFWPSSCALRLLGRMVA